MKPDLTVSTLVCRLSAECRRRRLRPAPNAAAACVTAPSVDVICLCCSLTFRSRMKSDLPGAWLTGRDRAGTIAGDRRATMLRTPLGDSVPTGQGIIENAWMFSPTGTCRDSRSIG